MARRLAVALVVVAILIGVGTGWTIARINRSDPGANLVNPKFSESKLGPGWFLAAVVHGSTTRTPSTTLHLIAPDGADHAATTVPGNMAVISWSGDGRRAFLQGVLRPDTDTFGEVVDLRTGGITKFTMHGFPVDSAALGFSRPDGLEVLTRTYQRRDSLIERRLLDGGSPVVLAAKAAVGSDVVSTADGQALYIGEGGVIKLVSNQGTGQGIQVPSSAGCTPVRLWSSTELLAQCGDLAANIGDGYLAVLPLAGGRPRVIARDISDPLTMNLNAYVARGGIYTATQVGCGAGPLMRAGVNGVLKRASRLRIGPFMVLTSDGSVLGVVITDRNCKPVSVAWVDPKTTETKVLFAAGGLPVSFLAYPTATGVE